MSVRALDRVTVQDIRQSAEVPTVSKESQALLSNEVFSQQTYWVRRAFTDACSISDKARDIQDLSRTVDPKGNELVTSYRWVPYTLLITGPLCLAMPFLGTIVPVAWALPYAISAVSIAAIFAISLVESLPHTPEWTNSTQLTYEWQNITHQKHKWNNICMGVIDLPSYINDDPSLMQAKREFIQVYQWIRE